jgi:hypothetical protein
LYAGGLYYPTSDGTVNQVLSTNGSGVLSWQTINTDRISNGTSNVNISTANGNIQLVSGGNSVANITGTGANISGTLNVSGNTQIGSSSSGTLLVGSSTLRYTQQTTSAATITTLVTLAGSGFRVAEFLIKGEDSTGGKYSVATISAVRDASSIDFSTYGTVNLPSSSTTGTFSMTFDGTTAALRVTPSSSNSTVWTVQYRTM